MTAKDFKRYYATQLAHGNGSQQTAEEFASDLDQLIAEVQLLTLKLAADYARSWGDAPPRQGGRRDQLADGIMAIPIKRLSEEG